MLDTLAQEKLEFADFDRQVMELAPDFEHSNDFGVLRLTRESATAFSLPGGRPRCIPLRDASAVQAPALQLFGCRMDAQDGALGLWWTDGSAAVDPSWLITRGLPEPANFTAMLDGAWASAGWDLAATEPDPAATIVRDATPGSPVGSGMVMQSAALTDRGPVRATNQDAFLERPDRGLWAVADGMGGLRDGEVASRMVCDSLADMSIVATLDEQIEMAVSRLREVNEYLRRMATRVVNPVQSGSTVVLLLMHEEECAVLWAGDSRLYRLREHGVLQMTTDHSWAAQAADDAGGAEEDAITRAVGAEDVLELDTVRGDVRPGDRFLLCSDGIGRVLDIARLGELLQTGSPAACCAELIARSIAAGGKDNLTAVVIDCTPRALDPVLGDASFGVL